DLPAAATAENGQGNGGDHGRPREAHSTHHRPPFPAEPAVRGQRSAPKGRNEVARGNAPGRRADTCPSPNGAQSGRLAAHCALTGLLGGWGGRGPRALPWAVPSRPFGADP